MRDHLFQSLLLAESRFPNCALIVAGDFNRLDVKSIQRHFGLKQIVKKPTRKNAILDLVLTNMHDYYADPQHFPPFGLSDHHTVIVEAEVRESSRQSPKFILKRDKWESRDDILQLWIGNSWFALSRNKKIIRKPFTV